MTFVPGSSAAGSWKLSRLPDAGGMTTKTSRPARPERTRSLLSGAKRGVAEMTVERCDQFEHNGQLAKLNHRKESSPGAVLRARPEPVSNNRRIVVRRRAPPRWGWRLGATRGVRAVWAGGSRGWSRRCTTSGRLGNRNAFNLGGPRFAELSVCIGSVPDLYKKGLDKIVPVG
jgi:hypothetical protein